MVLVSNYEPNQKQALFHSSPCEEVFYGGAKGGGKSVALVIEGFLYGIEHPGATIYFFRETYDDLEANIVQEWITKIPKELYRYNQSKHIAVLNNGTMVYFRYISNDKDADGYQGRSIDWIGVDELTKHTEYAIQILLSCLRSPKGFPPRFRATGNPGGIGHTWVKSRYIEATKYGQEIYIDDITGNRVQFIPATVYDNYVLMGNDPAYVRRLENLPEDQRKAFLLGDWDIFAGQYFPEWRRDIHVVQPFEIPPWWKRFRAMDYGLDMCAVAWFAVDPQGDLFIYRELYESGLNLTQAAQKIQAKTDAGENISYTVASPDLWRTNRETGIHEAEIMMKAGLKGLIPADNDRIPGWRNLREYLMVIERLGQDGQKHKAARFKVFSNCLNAIRTIPALIHDDKKVEDVSDEPHELTHMPEAIRYGCMSRPAKPLTPEAQRKRRRQMYQDDQPISSVTGY
jgi:phage terminase large subunit